jgi:hypothetical protein
MTDDEQLELVKKSRLCLCGGYKRITHSCCESCFFLLSQSLQDKLHKEPIVHSAQIGFIPPNHGEVVAELTVALEPLFHAKTTGEYEDRLPGETDKARRYRLLHLANRGVALKEGVLAELLQQKRQAIGRVSSFSVYREVSREQVKSHLKNINICGGMQKV